MRRKRGCCCSNGSLCRIAAASSGEKSCKRAAASSHCVWASASWNLSLVAETISNNSALHSSCPVTHPVQNGNPPRAPSRYSVGRLHQVQVSCANVQRTHADTPVAVRYLAPTPMSGEHDE